MQNSGTSRTLDVRLHSCVLFLPFLNTPHTWNFCLSPAALLPPPPPKQLKTKLINRSPTVGSLSLKGAEGSLRRIHYLSVYFLFTAGNGNQQPRCTEMVRTGGTCTMQGLMVGNGTFCRKVSRSGHTIKTRCHISSVL